MDVALAIIAAAAVIGMIRSCVVLHQATGAMEDVGKLARETRDLAAALKAQNDALRERIAGRDC